MDELLGSVLQGLPSNAETATVAEQALNAALPDEELHEATVSDIVAAISILKRDMPKKLRDGGAPAIATRNQVWSIVKGDTGALRELDRLLQDGSVVSVTLPGYGNALMTREDFSSTIQRAKEDLETAPSGFQEHVWAIDVFADAALSKPGSRVQSSQLAAALQARVKQGLHADPAEGRPSKMRRVSPSASMLESCLSTLTAAGLAHRTGPRADVLALTVPGAGLFSKALRDGVKALESFLTKRKHNEIAEGDLFRRKPPPRSQVDWQFVVREMEGAGALQRLSTPGAQVLRLKKSDS